MVPSFIHAAIRQLGLWSRCDTPWTVAWSVKPQSRRLNANQTGYAIIIPSHNSLVWQDSNDLFRHNALCRGREACHVDDPFKIRLLRKSLGQYRNKHIWPSLAHAMMYSYTWLMTWHIRVFCACADNTRVESVVVFYSCCKYGSQRVTVKIRYTAAVRHFTAPAAHPCAIMGASPLPAMRRGLAVQRAWS